ncbi:MAG: sulfite exporter TauE/SafE family protein [Candidatus Omnitrophica bacterium]|nr:sulfite exporter TauE/SafE family protein [Candidatus Omnitrophota bacterium]
MGTESLVLLLTALSVGFLHTLLGPDHYLPFIVMSKARNWSMAKTALVTLACGAGHVLSSVVLGFIGIALGMAVFRLEKIESLRGEIAGWLLLIFGFAYFVWGVHAAIRNRPHTHRHDHAGDTHSHEHRHDNDHLHVHAAGGKVSVTPWILFTIFVFGPCEALIPVLMYPAAEGNMLLVLAVVACFSAATLTTMLGVVLLLSYGLIRIPLGRIERYSHAVAGLMIFLCGSAMTFLGL